jgi:hypothetical protein
MFITQAKKIAIHRSQLQRTISYRGTTRSCTPQAVQYFMPRAHFPSHDEAGYGFFPAENKDTGNENENQDSQITSRA